MSHWGALTLSIEIYNIYIINIKLNWMFHIFAGELHVPLEVCGAVVKRELEFWQINQHAIKSCCWRHYKTYIENKRILDSFNRSLKKEQFSLDLDDYKGWKKFQMRVWLILEHPRTSKAAMVGSRSMIKKDNPYMHDAILVSLWIIYNVLH